MLRAGPYPAYLKERILSDHGHLSNEMGGKLAVWAAKQGASRIILAHLSKENNLPAVALAAAKNALNDNGISGVELLAAPRDCCSGWLEV
jgi:phosphoribosyl 1,2-cyclic phosphodiesterase